MSDKIPNDQISHLKRKPYVRRPELLKRQSVRFMFFGVDLGRFFGGCFQKAAFHSDNGLQHRVMQCGENTVHQIENGNHSLDQTGIQEELQLRVEGQIDWGEPTRPSGWFSNGILGRRYGRDWQDTSNKPDFIFLDPSKVPAAVQHQVAQTAGAESVRVITPDCEKPVHVVREVMKDRILKEYFTTYDHNLSEDAYNRGYKEAKYLHYDRGYADGLASVAVAKTVAGDSCQEALRTMKRMMNKDCEQRLESQRQAMQGVVNETRRIGRDEVQREQRKIRDLKRKVQIEKDEQFARGVQDEMRRQDNGGGMPKD